MCNIEKGNSATTVNFQTSIAEVREGLIKSQRILIQLKDEKIEILKKRIIDLELDQSNTNEIRVKRVWSTKLFIEPKTNNN